MWHRSDTFATHFQYTSQRESPWRGTSVTVGAKLLWQPRAEAGSHWWTSFSMRNDLLDAKTQLNNSKGICHFPVLRKHLTWASLGPCRDGPFWHPHQQPVLLQLLFGPATCSISSNYSNTPCPCTCPFPGCWWKTSPANPLLCKWHLCATGAGKQAQAQAPPRCRNTLVLGDALPLPSFLWEIH